MSHARNLESKEIARATNAKPTLETVIEQINETFKNYRCPWTTEVPIVPYKAKRFDKEARHSPNPQELGALLRNMTSPDLPLPKDPYTQKPILIEDVGHELVPDHALIQQVDQFLQEKGYTRKEYLNYFGISEQLYQFLLRYDGKKHSKTVSQRLRKLLSRGIQYLPLFIFYTLIFSSYACAHYDGATKRAARDYTELMQHFNTIRGYTYVVEENNRGVLTNIPSDYCFGLARNAFNNYKRYLIDLISYIFSDLLLCDIVDHYIFDSTFQNRGRLSVHPNIKIIGWGSALDVNDFSPLSITGLTVAAASTYTSARIYQLLSNSTEEASRTHKMLLIIFTLFIILLGVDALTESFGLISMFNTILPFLTTDACARACTDRLIMENPSQTYFYNNGNQTALVLEKCQSGIPLKQETAAVLTIAAPLAAGFWGVYNRIRNKKTIQDEIRALKSAEFNYYTPKNK